MRKVKEFGFDASAFLVGTQSMSHHEVGHYIRTLAIMSDIGRMEEKDVVELYGEMPAKVKAKFKEDRKGKLYNVRLEKAIEKQLKKLEKAPMSEQEGKDYQECKELYFEWYKNNHDGISPNLFSYDFDAFKKMNEHFRKIISEKKMIDTRPVDSFELILDNWMKLPPQIQSQIKPSQIWSNFNNIITHLKNGGIKRKSKVDSYRESTSRIEQIIRNKQPKGN